jgi:hypothetical protein
MNILWNKDIGFYFKDAQSSEQLQLDSNYTMYWLNHWWTN